VAETRNNPKTEYVRALDALTRYLALRDHSRAELRQKLSRRFDGELVERLLTEAEDNGWLGDEQVIAERAAEAFQRRHKSRRYVEGQLRKRQLPLPPRDDEMELNSVRALVKKKFGEGAELSYEDKAKAFRFLKYRGFDDRLIRQVLNEKRED
jgi:regulatory protein